MTLATDTPSSYWLGVALAIGALLLFSCCALVTSVASRRLDSNAGSLLSAAVTLPVGILLSGTQLLFNGALLRPSLWGVAAFLAAGVFSTYLGRWLFFKSIEVIGPTRASGFQTSSPIVTALLGWLLLGERLSAVALAGMALGVSGLIVMSRGAGKRQATAGPAPAVRHAMATRAVLAIGLGSSAAYAVSNILRAAAVRQWNEPVVGATLGATAGLLVLLVINVRRLPSVRSAVRAHPNNARMYCGVGAMQFVAQALTIGSMKFIPASLAALITMCMPIVVVPVSLFVLRQDEQIRLGTLLGLLATIAGVALVTLFGGLR